MNRAMLLMGAILLAACEGAPSMGDAPVAPPGVDSAGSDAAIDNGAPLDGAPLDGAGDPAWDTDPDPDAAVDAMVDAWIAGDGAAVDAEAASPSDGGVADVMPGCAPDDRRFTDDEICVCTDAGDWLCEPRPLACRKLSYESDVDADGVADRRTIYTYDEAGHRRTLETDEDRDGRIDYVQRFTVDARGRVLETETDAENDGAVDYRVTTTYDAEGRQTSLVLVSLDADGAMTSRQRTETSYHPAGHEARVQQDTNDDGRFDVSAVWTPDGLTRVEERDTDHDGVVDRRHTEVWDAFGVRVLSERDDDGDGIIDRVRRALPIRDADGNLIELQSDDDGDGIVDRRERHTYVEGQPVRSTYDDDGDDRPDRARTREFDADRVLVERYYDTVGDLIQASHWRYDGEGRTIVRAIIRPDGSLRSRDSTRYDALGNQITVASDSDGDGRPDWIQSSTYACSSLPAPCADDAECEAEPDCVAMCTPWGVCAQTCDPPLPIDWPHCREGREGVELGTRCAPCGGVWQAAPECGERAICVGGSAPNACGGCRDIPSFVAGNPFAQIPGAPCGDGHTYVCADRDHLGCTLDDGAVGNACLRDDDLPEPAGAPCGDGIECRLACEAAPDGDGLACVCD